MPTGPVEVLSWNCDPARDLEPQGLGVTYWFDAAATGDPYPVSVRFTGRRVTGPERSGLRESFDVVHSIPRVLPGAGRIALTATISRVAPGNWHVTAAPVPPAGPARRDTGLPHGRASGSSTFLPAARTVAPGVRLAAWPSLVGLGALAALALQGALSAQRHLPVAAVLLISLAASVVGLVGAKAYYLLTHRQEKGPLLRAGMSVQGFVLAALTVLVLAGRWAGVPLGALLDVSAPALLLGMAIGRLGCLLGGCCSGRPTASRWGIWSSDRRLGVRRVPVQLMESALAVTIASAALVAVERGATSDDGLLLVAALSAYILGRQLLFPLRGLPRITSWGRSTTLVIAALVLGGTLMLLISAPVF